MDIATVTSKGQITVPARMREALGLKPGSKIVFEPQPNGSYVVRRKTMDIRELRELLPPANRTVSIEEMKDAVGEAVAERRLDRHR